VLCPLATGAAGDAAKDFLNDVSKQADALKDSVNKQADAVKQSAAAAVEDLKSQVGRVYCQLAAKVRQRAQHRRISGMKQQFVLSGGAFLQLQACGSARA
jgi:hypothetical protein